MTLVNRVSTFFLSALAFSLLVNAVLLCGIVNAFLGQRFEQELAAALHTLVAAVEVEDDDVKFERSDHTIALGVDEGRDDLRWVVLGDGGRVVDHSRNLAPDDPSDGPLLRFLSEAAPADQISFSTWRVLRHRLSAPHPKPVEERTAQEFAALQVVVARSPVAWRSTVRQLALVVGLLSVGTWLVAMFGGRAYCRSALRPVQEMAARVRFVHDADFRLRLPVGPGRDELSELAAAFNALLDQLQQAYERQRRFTGDAAHQLRTPLTVLLGQIDVSLRRPRSADDYQQTLTLLRTQTAELQQIVEALLFLARTEGDATLPNVEPQDCRAWLESYIGRWHAHDRAGDLSLYTPASMVLTTSWPLVTQLLDNLVGNAFKYSPTGTPVTLSLTAQPQGVGFVVADAGPGIAADEHESVFDPFYRSPAARQANIPGTGLGLAVAAVIVRALRGMIDVESEPGRGSRFRVTLTDLTRDEIDKAGSSPGPNP